jgi:hypothetical protein
MNETVKSGKKRLSLYYLRVCDALDKDDRASALAHLSELNFISKRLWTDLSKDVSFPSGKE